jgi:hypothetical protein
MVVCGSVSTKATLCLVSGGEEYVKLGLPGPFLSVLAYALTFQAGQVQPQCVTGEINFTQNLLETP